MPSSNSKSKTKYTNLDARMQESGGVQAEVNGVGSNIDKYINKDRELDRNIQKYLGNNNNSIS